MKLQKQLEAVGLTLPNPPAAVANYQAVQEWEDRGLLWVSGQLPVGADGKLMAQGPVPSTTSLELAREAAATCVLRGVSALNEHLNGRWNDFEQVLRVGVYVASDATFIEQHRVADGASDLLVKLFGEVSGRHARAAVGVSNLPLGASVEVEMLVAVKPPPRQTDPD